MLFLALVSYNWQIKTVYYLRDTIKLINASITSNGYYFCTVRTLRMYSLHKFQVHNRVLLTIYTVLYIRSPEFIHLITGSFYPWTNIFPTSPNLQPLATIILLMLETQAGNQAFSLGQVKGKFEMNRNMVQEI